MSDDLEKVTDRKTWVKITFVCPEVNQSGGNRVTSIYARKLLERGHEVTVIGRRPAKVSFQRKTLSRLRGTWKPLKDRDIYFRALGDRFHWLDYKFPLDESDLPDADVIVATWWRTAFEVAAMPPKKGKKAYFVQHHEVHDHLPYDVSAGSYWLPLKKIAVASWLVDTMGDLYDDHDVALVPNAVDTDQFDAAPRERSSVPSVGLMYSTTWFKGLETMLKALEIARSEFPNLKVTAFGARPPDPKFPLPSGTSYHCSPSQKDIPSIYASCDAWLFGSRSEGFGLPILEAMACRTPIAATNAGAAPDLIEQGVNGFLVDVDDAQALGKALIAILSRTTEEWNRMSDACYALAHSYSWDEATVAFEGELQKIVDSH